MACKNAELFFILGMASIGAPMIVYTSGELHSIKLFPCANDAKKDDGSLAEINE